MALIHTFKNNKIALEYMPTDQMVTDILMKGLLSPKTKILKSLESIRLEGLLGAYMCTNKINPNAFQLFFICLYLTAISLSY